MSVLVSALALAISSITTVYTQIGHRENEIRSKKEEYRKIMMDLIALREEFIRASGAAPNPAALFAVSQQLGATKHLLLEDAERVATDIPTHLTVPDHETPAHEHANDSNCDQAEKYVLRAAAVARRPTIQADTYRRRIIVGRRIGRSPWETLPPVRITRPNAAGIQDPQKDPSVVEPAPEPLPGAETARR